MTTSLESTLARRSASVDGPVASMERAALLYLHSVRDTVEARVRKRRNDFPRAMLREADPLTDTLLQDATKKGASIKKAVKTYGTRAASAGAYSASQDLGISVGVVLGVGNPLAVDYLEQRGADLITSINATTRDAIQALLAQGAAEGWSVDKLAYEIGQDFSFSWARARMIARTEMTNAYSEGSLARAQALVDRTGVTTEKRWIVNEPEDDECIENGDSEWIDVAEAFPSGDARPPVHPNCECALVFRIVAEAGGALALSADYAPGVVDDVLARRRSGESFPTIAAAHGQKYGAWAYGIVKRNAPELLGKVTPEGGFTGKTIRARPTKAVPATGAPGEAEKWWLLSGDKFQTLYPEIADVTPNLAGKLRTLKGVERATLGPESKALTEQWIANNPKVPAYLRDIKIARVSEMDAATTRNASVGSNRANAWVTSFSSDTVALRAPSFIAIEDSPGFAAVGWKQDTEFTIMHELGHHANYRAGLLLPPGMGGEKVANLWAERMLGRRRYEGIENVHAAGARAHIGPAPGPNYTAYGQGWHEVTAADRAFVDKIIALGDRTLNNPIITMREAGLRIVFGLWRCQDGIAPKAIKAG